MNLKEYRQKKPLDLSKRNFSNTTEREVEKFTKEELERGAKSLAKLRESYIKGEF